MEAEAAVDALVALGQERRLAIFRLLVEAGPDGISAGLLADRLGVPNSSLSFHLSQLRDSGLISQERQHRLIIYRANFSGINALVNYLVETCCCDGVCGLVVTEIREIRQKGAGASCCGELGGLGDDAPICTATEDRVGAEAVSAADE